MREFFGKLLLVLCPEIEFLRLRVEACRAQADHLRRERDRAVVAVVRNVVEGDMDRHDGLRVEVVIRISKSRAMTWSYDTPIFGASCTESVRLVCRHAPP